MFAVVAMDCLLPGAPDAEAWIRLGEPRIRRVDPARWPMPVAGIGREIPTTAQGAFVDAFAFDPHGLEVEVPYEALDPLFSWVVHVVRGVAPPERRRTSLTLATLGLPSTGHVRAVADRTDVAWLRGGHPLDRAQAGGPAGIAARALGLGGEVDALDAACASGLYAVRVACDHLASGEVDCAIAAAVNRSDSAYLFHGFTQLHALSPSGVPRPFDRRADGLVIGEGAAAVALKRLDDAIRDGDRIHAVIRSTALGADGRKGNLLAPAVDGQLRTLRRAWQEAGLDPRTVGYVECHATGTTLGDGTELRALEALLAGRDPALPRVVVGSAKGMIGHTVTAAGLAGLLRAVGAVRDGVLPGTPGCEEPRAELAESRILAVLPERTPWEGPRRAAVSAFGFGGTNAHLVIDAWDESLGAGRARTAPRAGRPAAEPGGEGRLAVVALAVQFPARAPLPASRYRIPPLELAELLPRQRLALDLATEALDRVPELDRARTASVLGFEVDPAIDPVVVRWALLGDGRPDAADAAHPPLGTSRVQGSLPNFLANRIAAQHDLQGPSYVVAAGAASGTRALRHAARLLRNPALDAVVVGAVGDDGGAVLIVRRATDADPALARLAFPPAPPPELPSLSPELPGADPTAQLRSLVDALQTGRATTVGGVHVAPAGLPTLQIHGDTPDWGPLRWDAHRPASAPMAAPPPAPVSVAPAVDDLAAALARATTATADAHARWLDASERALMPLAALGEALARATTPPDPTPPGLPAPADDRPPTSWDRAALLRHAGGSLSSVFGPRYRDLDRWEPRVRMPLPPLLLVDRVVAIEGERGRLGPSRIITEYDVPHGQAWTADGRPPAFVVVESGQADLFLVSFLGIDAECRGERIYRLLDCDLRFVGPRPAPGTTLRHDIRIERFARLGVTTLFYFRYDCVDAATGAPVLEMRNGCAGFFAPHELATPRGLQDRPREAPLATPLVPRIEGAPGALDAAAVDALVDGRFSTAFGRAFAPADGSTLRLPPDRRWRLVHRVVRLSLSGGPHGHGEVLVEQDLHDDDWFNPVHFQGDPCMPGTLMLEGCLQAVQIWLSALGVAAEYPGGTFEVVDRPIRLRCRGQVAPGHRVLRYHARIVEAGLEPYPWAVADVVLSVDGTPVVVAHDVGVRVDGVRVPLAPAPAPIGRDRVLEFSVGSAVRAFGPAYAAFDGPARRCARMPGPPILQMTEVLAVEGPQGEIAADRAVVIAWDVPEDAWFWRADPEAPMPFVILLETALQPCGWLTAWQAAGIAGGRDLYFRNLGGTTTVHTDVRRGTVRRLITTARQTDVAVTGAMQIQRFTTEVRDGDRLVFSCETQFGYFTEAALTGQKGLSIPVFPATPPVAIPLAGHPSLPRDDLRMIDRIVGADPTAGRYVAEKDVSRSDWYFTAHFWLDPVMPGSLGLEALLQLARWVFHSRTGKRGQPEIVPGDATTWTYRGQVRRDTAVMGVELEILSEEAGSLRCRGTIRADGLPIYRFDGFGVREAEAPVPEVRAAPARTPAAALLDTFTVTGDHGVGQLRLDPALHPWLDQHRPTMAAAAVPLAFVAEIAAEAASLLAPGLQVVGLPDVRAERWIHTGEGPVDLTVVAVRDGTDVAVTLAVGRTEHARALVRLGTAWSPPPPVLDPEGDPIAWDGAAFFASGRTFHGPVLQGMTALVRLGPEGAVARLRTRADAALLGRPGRFVLDPLLLDSATHPMLSGEPEHWRSGLPPGRLAYPVRAEGLALHGPRPTGDVTCRIHRVSADLRALVFDVELEGGEGVWCTYRWHEIVVPGGPVLGRPPAVRRRFLWDGEGVPEVSIGRAVDAGWEVRPGDLVEPIPGTLVALYGAPGHPDPLGVLAGKEAVRQHLRAALGREVHPRDLALVPLRPGTWLVAAAPSLTAVEYVAHLHPTRIVVRTEPRGVAVVARTCAP